MGEVRCRKADDRAEKPDNAQAIKESYMKGALTGAAAVAAAGVASAISNEKTRDKLERDMRSDERKFRSAEMASRRRARALDKQMDSDKNTARRLEKSVRGGGGGLYVTPDAATGRDVTKRFKRN